MSRLLPLLLSVLLAGCASSHMLTGTPRAAIDLALVQIYHAAPPGPYEEIAQLTSHSGVFVYGEQNKVNSVLYKLRREAAKLGANGVLFVDSYDDAGGGSAVSVGGGGGRLGRRSFSSGGLGVNIGLRQKHAVGIAIYVPDPAQTGD